MSKVVRPLFTVKAFPRYGALLSSIPVPIFFKIYIYTKGLKEKRKRGRTVPARIRVFRVLFCVIPAKKSTTSGRSQK